MAILVVQEGIATSFVSAAAGGDEFVNNGRTQLYVLNSDPSSITVSFIAFRKCDQNVLHTYDFTAPDGGTRVLGPFETFVFNNSNDRVEVTYSSVTNISVAAVSILEPI